MPLTLLDQEKNRVVLRKVCHEVRDFYSVPGMDKDDLGIDSKLNNLLNDIFSFLDENEIVLVLRDQQVLKQLLVELIPCEDVNKIRTSLNKYINSKLNNRETTGDIFSTLHTATFTSAHGSIEDLKKVLHGYIKAPADAVKKVEILSSIDLTLPTSNETLFSHIRTVMRNKSSKTEKLFIPVICEEGLWRLIIITFKSNKRKIDEAVLYDPKVNETLLETSAYKIMKAAVLTLDPTIKQANIKSYTAKRTSAAFETMDYVARKSLRALPGKRTNSNQLIRELCESDDHWIDYIEPREVVIKLIQKHLPRAREEGVVRFEQASVQRANQEPIELRSVNNGITLFSSDKKGKEVAISSKRTFAKK